MCFLREMRGEERVMMALIVLLCFSFHSNICCLDRPGDVIVYCTYCIMDKIDGGILNEKSLKNQLGLKRHNAVMPS